MSVYEVNFDGLVGPTHNYAGLAPGNLHSINNKSKPSNPRKAALQGLDKMKLMHDLGYKQAIIPPQERPLIDDYDDYLNMVVRASASSMWVANSSTVVPSVDSDDGRLHLLTANLNHTEHRRIEPPQTHDLLNKIFNDSSKFLIHSPLQSDGTHDDEGAANHTRFCKSYDEEGLHLFIYGRSESSKELPTKFPARQTREASEKVASEMGVKNAVYAQQSPESIDAGVFHHDVTGVGNKNLYFYHEKTLLAEGETIAQLQDSFDGELKFLRVEENEIPLELAVETYLFNSQLVEYEGGHMLVAPIRCRRNARVRKYLQGIVGKNKLIKKVRFSNLEQSLWNGGGPACLRLRVVMTDEELNACHQGVVFTDELYLELRKWVRKYYWGNLIYDDLFTPKFIKRCRASLNELTDIMDLGKIYPFQKK
jgi:succinylarginine dihydrolase